MVNLGIKQLQQLVQQPPSDYASTDRDDKSAMEATSKRESSVEKHVIKREDAGKTRRDAVIGTAVEHHRHHRVGLHQDIAANIVQKESAAGKQTNGTPNRPTSHTAKSLAAMAFPTHHQKMYRIQNEITTRNVGVEDRIASAKRLGFPTRRMANTTDDGVGTWTRIRARNNRQE